MSKYRLIEAFPDEHLVGMLVREKLLSGYKRDQSVRRYMDVGSRKIKPQDISNGVISGLARYYSMGSVDEEIRLIREHSISALWWASVGCFDGAFGDSKVMSAEVLPRIEHQSDRHLSFSKSWKLCPLCVEKQLDEMHCSFWRVSHQIPGMSICLEHNVVLLTSDHLKVLEPLILPEDAIRTMELNTVPNVGEKWSDFVFHCFAELQSGLYEGRELLEKIRPLIGVLSKLKSTEKKKIDSLLKVVEDALSVDFLSNFFSFYANSNGIGRARPNFLWSLLSPDSRKLRHPVYLLLVLYFLDKKPSDLLGVGGHYAFGRSVAWRNAL